MKKLVLFWICIVGLSMTGCRAGQQEIERNNAAESTVGQQPEEPVPEEATEAELQSREQIMEESVGYTNLQQITLDSTWEYADHSKINTGAAVLYPAPEESGRLGEGHRRQYGGGSNGSCSSFRRHDVSGRHPGAGGDITYGTDPAG